MNPDPVLNPVLAALNRRCFFKLICGGSFSDAEKLQKLLDIYLATGLVSAVDISAAWPVVCAALEVYRSQAAPPPMLMVSFPLDNDPHFRKIQLVEENCIACGHCVPACPTQVFSLDGEAPLAVDTPACYGCGRCVPVCPTEALVMDPFTVHPDLPQVLAQPEVTAVELHTTHADPVLVETLYQELGPLLADKLISVCLRPQTLPTGQVLAFLNTLQKNTPYPLIVQVDGIPMSGSSDDPEASLPALEAAIQLAPGLPPGCHLTVSGGINGHTARYLQMPRYRAIEGVGMGTCARRQVWDFLDSRAKAIQIAESFVKRFLARATSVIMEV